MKYLVESAVKAKIHESGKQITKDGLFMLDVKVGEFLDKAIKQFNGHHTRIDATLIKLIKL